jgi:hypothetical protein
MQAGRGVRALRSALDAGLALPWGRLWAPLRRAAAKVMALPFWLVFAVLLVGQWVVVGIVGTVAQHNGWIHYSGGDDSWYYTSAWVIGRGHVPYASVGYGVPLLLAPLTRIAGPNLGAAMPFVVVLDMLVLWPAALAAVYGIAKTIGGRGYAYLVALAWILFPLAAIPYFYGRYHGKLVDQILPQALGLVATADFAAMVALLVAAYFALQAVVGHGSRVALIAGLATGVALAVKPSNAIFLPAPLVALAVARRPRELLLLAAGLAPALIALATWKYRGLGSIPAFSSSSTALALDGSPPLVGGLQVHRYFHPNWGHLWDSMYGVREYTWSLRMITWVLVAGVIALARRSGAVAVLIGGWLASFIVVKGTSTAVNVSDGSFFRFMTAAFPAFFLELAALPLLVPVFGRRLAAIGRAAAAIPDSRRIRTVGLAAGVVLTVVPIALFALLRPLSAPSATRVPAIDQYIPANTFALTASTRPSGTVVLRWPSQATNGTRMSYAIFREPWDGLTCGRGGSRRLSCAYYSDPRTSMQLLHPTAWSLSTSYRDRPGPGHWVYRVVATADQQGPPAHGNYVALSRRADASASP